MDDCHRSAISLSLRFGQITFSGGSLLFMFHGTEFFGYTAFCFLATIMGLVLTWCLALAIVDPFAAFFKHPFRQPKKMIVIALGDWVLLFMSLAAASSAASVIDYLLTDSDCGTHLCGRFQVSVVFSLASWFLLVCSFVTELWLLFYL